MESISASHYSIETIDSYVFKGIVNYLRMQDCVALWHTHSRAIIRLFSVPSLINLIDLTCVPSLPHGVFSYLACLNRVGELRLLNEGKHALRLLLVSRHLQPRRLVITRFFGNGSYGFLSGDRCYDGELHHSDSDGRHLSASLRSCLWWPGKDSVADSSLIPSDNLFGSNAQSISALEYPDLMMWDLRVLFPDLERLTLPNLTVLMVNCRRLKGNDLFNQCMKWSFDWKLKCALPPSLKWLDLVDLEELLSSELDALDVSGAYMDAIDALHRCLPKTLLSLKLGLPTSLWLEGRAPLRLLFAACPSLQSFESRFEFAPSLVSYAPANTTSSTPSRNTDPMHAIPPETASLPMQDELIPPPPPPFVFPPTLTRFSTSGLPFGFSREFANSNVETVIWSYRDHRFTEEGDCLLEYISAAELSRIRDNPIDLNLCYPRSLTHLTFSLELVCREPSQLLITALPNTLHSLNIQFGQLSGDRPARSTRWLSLIAPLLVPLRRLEYLSLVGSESRWYSEDGIYEDETAPNWDEFPWQYLPPSVSALGLASIHECNAESLTHLPHTITRLKAPGLFNLEHVHSLLLAHPNLHIYALPLFNDGDVNDDNDDDDVPCSRGIPLSMAVGEFLTTPEFRPLLRHFSPQTLVDAFQDVLRGRCRIELQDDLSRCHLRDLDFVERFSWNPGTYRSGNITLECQSFFLRLPWNGMFPNLTTISQLPITLQPRHDPFQTHNFTLEQQANQFNINIRDLHLMLMSPKYLSDVDTSSTPGDQRSWGPIAFLLELPRQLPPTAPELRSLAITITRAPAHLDFIFTDNDHIIPHRGFDFSFPRLTCLNFHNIPLNTLLLKNVNMPMVQEFKLTLWGTDQEMLDFFVWPRPHLYLGSVDMHVGISGHFLDTTDSDLEVEYGALFTMSVSKLRAAASQARIEIPVTFAIPSTLYVPSNVRSIVYREESNTYTGKLLTIVPKWMQTIAPEHSSIPTHFWPLPLQRMLRQVPSNSMVSFEHSCPKSLVIVLPYDRDYLVRRRRNERDRNGLSTLSGFFFFYWPTALFLLPSLTHLRLHHCIPTALHMYHFALSAATKGYDNPTKSVENLDAAFIREFPSLEHIDLRGVRDQELARWLILSPNATITANDIFFSGGLAFGFHRTRFAEGEIENNSNHQVHSTDDGKSRLPIWALTNLPFVDMFPGDLTDVTWNWMFKKTLDHLESYSRLKIADDASWTFELDYKSTSDEFFFAPSVSPSVKSVEIDLEFSKAPLEAHPDLYNRMATITTSWKDLKRFIWKLPKDLRRFSWSFKSSISNGVDGLLPGDFERANGQQSAPKSPPPTDPVSAATSSMGYFQPIDSTTTAYLAHPPIVKSRFGDLNVLHWSQLADPGRLRRLARFSFVEVLNVLSLHLSGLLHLILNVPMEWNLSMTLPARIKQLALGPLLPKSLLRFEARNAILVHVDSLLDGAHSDPSKSPAVDLGKVPTKLSSLIVPLIQFNSNVPLPRSLQRIEVHPQSKIADPLKRTQRERPPQQRPPQQPPVAVDWSLDPNFTANMAHMNTTWGGIPQQPLTWVPQPPMWVRPTQTAPNAPSLPGSDPNNPIVLDD